MGANAILRDWRQDPAVDNRPCQAIRIWSSEGIPALLDGETVRLGAVAQVRYVPAVVRVLAPPRAES